MIRLAGIDVHKDFLEVAFRELSGRVKVIRIEYTPKGLNKLIKLLRKYGITDAYMESTGDYYLPLYYALKGAGIRPHVMNAYKIRRPEANKTDERDAVWLLEIGESDLFSDSYVPNEDIQALRFLMRKRMKLVDRISNIKREINNILWRLGLQASQLAKKLRSKKKRKLLLDLLEGRLKPDSISDSDVRELYDVLSKSEFRAYIFVLKSRLAELAYLESQLEEFDREIEALARKFEDIIRILMSVPGISFILAVGILSEIGDINRFLSPGHLASYAGLIPIAKNSGGKRRVGRPSKKTNKYLRRYMFLAGMAAVRSRSCVVREFFQRLLGRGKHYKVAVVAVARKLLCVIWYLLRRGEFWREDNYFKGSRRLSKRRRVRISVREAIGILVRAGYVVRKRT
ncbi:MAG: IS110 family transposase [Candidatus Njordarchaeum guaymaensis]